MTIVTMKLKKHFGANVAGEIASFSESTAAHIKKHDGGEELARFDEGTHRFDSVANKAVPLAKKA